METKKRLTLKLWSVNNTIVGAPTKEDAIKVYRSSRMEDFERFYEETWL